MINPRFKTGDIAQKDDERGYRILGRKSVDIIKSGGYKISALEIEKEILECPGIVDVSVIGIPCTTLGEKIVAIVSSQSSKTFENARELLKTKLASYKLPREYKRLDVIPRNALGKVNKKDLAKYFD
jgi:malonyl-CoA/methylmalonyl-CoA synthetase